MQIIKKLIVLLDNMSFKSKIVVVFTIFCILQTIIMSAIFLQQSINTTMRNTADQLLSIVQTKNEIADMRLKAISENIVLLNFDSKLFEIFDSYDKYSPFDKLSIPDEMQKLYFRYFGDASDIYSINLLSSKINISNRPYHFEYSHFINSPVLYRPENDRNYTQYWIPRFNIREFVNEVDPVSNVRYGFATVKKLNLTTLYNTSFIALSPLTERPYLLIAFDADFFRSFYLNATGFNDSGYMIVSPGGEIVSGNHYPLEDDPLSSWFGDAKQMKSGILYVELGGVETIVCFATSSVTGWITAITTPVNALTSNAISMQRQLVMISLVLAIMILAFYFLSAALLAKPIKQLVKHAYGPESAGESTSNEIKLLSYAFENVDHKLKNLMNEYYKIQLSEKETKIAILNAQIKPHFIYNTLNTINWMAIENNETKISKMVVNLAGILQYIFRDYEIIVPCSEEVNWVKQYLFIMANRFNDKFVVDYDIDPVLLNCFVPKLLLQPLVENSIIHGFHEMSAGGLITISGWISDHDVYLSVMDNGCGIPEDKASSVLNHKSSSVGCYNVDHKLKLIYGPEYGIQIHSIENRGTTITARMPVRYNK